ncbi:hypothetical protein KAH37_08965 [bacterium]|nr:hypothetical protein [bacterium]
MRFLTLTVAVLLLLFTISCGSNSTSSKNDEDTQQDSEMTDSDESDSETADDDTSEISDSDETELPDEPFLVPNRGLTFSITAKMLATSPAQSTPPAEYVPTTFFGELILNDGEKVSVDDDKHSYISLWKPDGYDDKYLVVAATAATSSAYYSIQAYSAVSTFEWMTKEDVSIIPGLQFYLYVYKSWYENNNKLYISCPIALGKSDDTTQLYADSTDKEWIADETEHIMVNSQLTFDHKELLQFFRGANYVELCQCYDIAGSSFTQRKCEAEEIDMPPTEPVWPSPQDGIVSVALDSELSWTESTDPDGGTVSYSILFGKTNPPTDKIASDLTTTSFPATLEKDTRYYWQVIAKDEEDNETGSAIWTFDTSADSTTFVNHDLLIVISEKTYGESLATVSAIEGYLTDLDDEGITNALFVWQPGSAEVLRDIIKKHVATYETKGVLLLGEMPAAWFEQTADYGGDIGKMYEQFPIDIFLADTNGIWEDTDKNGIYDVHPTIDVEIFISRIPGTAKQIQEYLHKVNKYKTSGSLAKSRSFYSFMDDDWNGYAGWTNQTWELESIYETRYIRHEDDETSTKEKYVEQMRGDGAEFVYQWIHTSPHRIYFDDNYSPNPDNILPIEEIRTPPVYGSFYNLFNCSVSRFTEEGGTLAIAYLHSPNGLATFGSTKTGGSYQPYVFNENLANGGNWGTSWKLWINDTFSNGENNQTHLDSWWLGMVVLGDPTLRLTDKVTPPQVLSIRQQPKLSKEQKETLNKFLRDGYQYQHTDSFRQYKLRHPEFF